jgi:amino acid transporter
VNVLSGVISSVVFVGVTEITGGDIAKFFGVALSLAISTTLISYLGIFPAAWKLRRTRPDHPLPYRAPALGLLTVVSMAWIAFCTVQLLFPGLGDGWFGADYRLDGWAASEKWVYLFTELVPLAVFVAIAVGFWAAGRRNVRRTEEVEPIEQPTR